jgi:AraC-like DNA-binding protein
MHAPRAIPAIPEVVHPCAVLEMQRESNVIPKNAMRAAASEFPSVPPGGWEGSDPLLATATKQVEADTLGDALEFLRMSETSFYYSELAAPWSITMSELSPKFFFVTSGRCWLEVKGSENRLLEAGDLAVVTHGSELRLNSDPTSPLQKPTELVCERISKRYAIYRNGGRGPLARFIAGDVIFSHPAACHLISLLPEIILQRSAQYHMMEWLHSTSRFLAIESRDLRPGGESIITRMADIMVIQTIRSWIEQNPSELSGWLAAFRDPAISRSIALIHRKPDSPWTTASMAKSVGMSRSAFAESFSTLVGEPFMKYVTGWRMHLASIYLKTDRKGLEEIAPLLGYQSGAALSRAFKRSQGVSPGAVRRDEGANINPGALGLKLAFRNPQKGKASSDQLPVHNP